MSKIKRTEFVEAYQWYFGETKKKANETFNNAVCCADYDYINSIIDGYKEHLKYSGSFYD